MVGDDVVWKDRAEFRWELSAESLVSAVRMLCSVVILQSRAVDRLLLKISSFTKGVRSSHNVLSRCGHTGNSSTFIVKAELITVTYPETLPARLQRSA